MPPKLKFTKDEIISAALNLTAEKGAEALTARALAERLGSSVKPIFGLFENMNEVRAAVIEAADKKYQSYIDEDMSKGEYPPYKASGMAYIRFAREEKELFKLLFMRDRRGEKIIENRDAIRPLINIIMNSLNLSEDEAYLFHLELWLYVHGIATMIATSYLDWDIDFASKAITDVYVGLKYRYTEKR